MRITKQSIISGEYEAKFQYSECGVFVIAIKQQSQDPGSATFKLKKQDDANFIFNAITHFLKTEPEITKNAVSFFPQQLNLSIDQFEFRGSWE